MNPQNTQNHDPSATRAYTDSHESIPLSAAGELRREEVRAALHHAIARRVVARRTWHASLAAVTLMGVTWLALRSSFAPTHANPANAPMAHSSPIESPITAAPTSATARTSPHDSHHPQSAMANTAATVAIVRDDPGILARLSTSSSVSRVEFIDDAQLLSELRPVRGEVGLIRVAGRVEIVDAAGTMRSNRGQSHRDPSRDQGNLLGSAGVAGVSSNRPAIASETPCL